MSPARTHRRVSLALLLALTIAALAPWAAPRALASDTPSPSSVTIAGSLQSEAGCPGDWDPACAVTHLSYDAGDDVWQAAFDLPAGSFGYKAALNDGWGENYGANAAPNGGDIGLALNAPRSVKFYYDHKSHWVTSNVTSRIVTAPGSFQSELGCAGDWDPGCLRSWLQDPDGDGTFVLEAALPAGTYEGKAAIDEAWGENYGAGGAPNGANIGFSVPANNTVMRFTFVSATNSLSIAALNQPPPVSEPKPDNNIEWDGLRHDSRDALYRTPSGAVPAGTPVKIRFRTFHNDVTAVALRLYNVNGNAQKLTPMTLAAADVSCYEQALEDSGCDFWEATVAAAAPNNFWYRFVVSDGTDTDYYADNTGALDGGLGAASDDLVDNSYALMFYDPAFTAPQWASEAVIYQIFPDRFRNGDTKNDPKTGDIRYDDPVVKLDWGVYPEGYCRNYADGADNCPWRFDDTPPEWSPTKESPRGRDYYGGDLQGVLAKLDHLKALGVTSIYFNPIFAAGSNHRYDTRDYYRIDPYLGNNGLFTTLAREAEARGIRLIVDSVFNHMSSDSAFFDRYGHYSDLGACESASSLYRSWFNFRKPTGVEPAPCAPSTAGGDDTYYSGWFGFDSIPEIKKSNPDVLSYFVTAQDSVSRFWLKRGAAGWRLDVMGDASFPAGYWESFRQATRQTKADSLIIGELWQKDSTLLRHLRGETADSTMNYRQRDAIIGLLTPGAFDAKGFGDSGRVISPSEFAARIESIREDYPDAAYYSLMNLLGSHDTERILWTLTPGAETLAERQGNSANLAEGKSRFKLASLIQFVMPGAPTVYYGDEVGVTGDDDPDDRRTYPWADLGGSPDTALEAHHKALAALRKSSPAFTRGDIRVLLADDDAGTVAIGRRSGNSGALTLINRSAQTRQVVVPVAGYFPNGTKLKLGYGVGATLGGQLTVGGGKVTVTLPALSGLALVTVGADLTAPGAPKGLKVTSEGKGEVSLAWGAVSGAAGYNVYRSPLSGGGWVQANSAPVSGTSFTDTGLRNGALYYYVVRALDAVGNEGKSSNEAQGLPRYTIGWANLQWPPTLSHQLSVTTRTDTVYGQIWIDGVTSQPGATAGLIAQLGYGPDGSDPATAGGWIWVAAQFNADAGNNDEFKASLLPEAAGQYDYAYRYSTTAGKQWTYADLDGIGNGYSPAQAGSLTATTNDTSAPAAPSGLQVTSASPAGVALKWNAVAGDASLYGYEVLRAAKAGDPLVQIARVTAATYTDTAVEQGATYVYAVRALDNAFNRSGNSNVVSATAEQRTVTLSFTVTVPSTTDATGRAVHIAGFLDRLDGGLPQWLPDGVKLTRASATSWTITLTGKEGTQIEYKYTLGAWDYVEKDTSCAEIANRTLTLAYGANGTQQVNDTIANWRNVSPCGN